MQHQSFALPVRATSGRHANSSTTIWSSRFTTPAAAPFVIRNVNIMTAAGPMIHNGAIAVADGKIIAVGQTVDAPAGAVVIDGGGKYLTPGIIDVHSHLGVYAAPGVDALSDGNEA